MGLFDFFKKNEPKGKKQDANTGNMSDKLVVIFIGYYKAIRDFFEKDGIPIETKVKNFLGKSDVESMFKMTNTVTTVIMNSDSVAEDLRKDYIAKGVPTQNIWTVKETGNFYADIPWETLIESDITDIETRRKMVTQPLHQHFSGYLNTKGYSDADIFKSTILFPDQLAKLKDHKLFENGSIGVSAYVVYVEFDMNDTVRKEIENKRKEAEEKHKANISAGKRVYYAAWIESGISSMSLGELPLLVMQLAQTFKISPGDIRSLTKKDWNPPAYGKISNDELKAKSSSGSQRFHKHLKEALAEYLLKQGYTHDEIESNYRVVGFTGRGGENFPLTVVFEMNLK